MTTIDEFLLARIAEEWQSALAYGSSGPSRHLRGLVPEPYGDPARVLAECEAKRRIVEHHRGPHDEHHHTREHSVDGYGDGEDCPTLRLLALPYADHPGYLEEWRP